MQDYDIKRGHWKNIDGDLLTKVVKDIFGNARSSKGTVTASYKALKKLTVSMEGKSILRVDTQMTQDVSDEDAMDTISKYNEFLLRATGFTSKERKKKLNKKAKDGKL